MTDTPRLGLPLLAAAQAQKHVTHNDALLALDTLAQLSVADIGAVTPPAAPAEGERHILGGAPTGAWAGRAGALAALQNGAWRFFTPQKGWVAWVETLGALRAFDGAVWQPVVGASFQNLAMLGVNATADATNKLAVSSAALLFSHAGAGVQAKMNKNAATDTASVLFQTGFSGRAEIGTTGDDDFHFKVSANGSSFSEALRLRGSRGIVDLPSQPAFDYAMGAATQSLAAATWTVVGANTALLANTTDFNTTTFRFTAPAAGRYLLGGAVAHGTTTGARQVALRVNGTTVIAPHALDSGTNPVVATQTIAALAQGDTVELVAQAAGAGVITGGASGVTHVYGHKLS